VPVLRLPYFWWLGLSLVDVRVCAARGWENPPDARFCNEYGAGCAAAPASGHRQVMRRYFDVARRVIEHYGGTAEKFTGDAVMAVFGVPVLHEDDALRAGCATADLLEEIAILNEWLEADFAATMSVRMGVTTGRVVTGTEERLATGQAVNLGARLEQVAGPGAIVIDPQTWRLVRGTVTAEPLQLRGKSHPVIAYG
jgi:class 3 adenylate cyclase